MDDADEGAATNGYSDHVGDVLEVAIGEGFRAVNGVNPHGDVFRLKVFRVGTRKEVD